MMLLDVISNQYLYVDLDFSSIAQNISFHVPNFLYRESKWLLSSLKTFCKVNLVAANILIMPLHY